MGNLLNKSKLTVYDLCQSMTEFKFNVIYEIGVWKAAECRSEEFIQSGKKVVLFEPEPSAFSDLLRAYGHLDNVTLVPKAISDKVEKVRFFKKGSSTFMEGLKSPAITDQGYCPNPSDSFEVDCVPISFFDEGNIDLLLLDMEGSEWFALKKLRSRPRLISVETHCENRYTNPYLKEIHHWMNENSYKTLLKNTTDTFYLRFDNCGKGGNDGW